MKLKQDIKRMLDALAYQDAGDYLPYRSKLKTLGVANAIVADGMIDNLPRNKSGRVAWLSDGSDQALDYALEVCSHQDVTLELVFHGKALGDQPRMQQLGASVSKAGISHQPIRLPGDTLSALAEYVNSHSNLLYLISSVSNPLAFAISQKGSQPEHRLRTPIVLFDEQGRNAIPAGGLSA